MFEKVRKLASMAQMKALSKTTGIPLHSIRQIVAGNNKVQYAYVEKLYIYFYGEEK